MSHREFIELLQRYSRGETTEEENRHITTYYNLFEPEASSLQFDGEKKREIKQDISNRIWQNIEGKDPAARRVIQFGMVLKYAAAVIAVVLVGSLFYYLYHSAEIKVDQLTFINNQKESRLIHLSDGSTAILNVGSTLKCPTTFADANDREVYLEGEAYFDIKQMERKTFIVHTGNVQTTVLETAFNIKAFSNDNNITVTVTRGKVRISEKERTLGLLAKGQQIIYNKEAGGSVQETATSRLDLDWQKQDVFFDDVTVEDAAKLLEDRFDVKIMFDDEVLKAQRFTTVFLKGERLEEVLKSICEFNEAFYHYDEKRATVIISKNNTRNN